MFESLLRRPGRMFFTLLSGLGLVALTFAIAGTTGATASDEGYAAEPPIEHELQFAVLENGEWYRVTVDFYLRDDATEADIAAATASVTARFEGAYPIGTDGVTAQFLVSGPHWPGNNLTWHYNSAGKPAGIPDGMDELTAAATTWNTAGASWKFVSGGYTSAGTGACGTQLDGQNTIGWVAQAGSVLAMTCTWSIPEAGGGDSFVEFDMEFDPKWSWTTSASGVNTDLQSVTLHEMGHALGLGHTYVNCPGSTMCATYSAGVVLHTLSGDDLAGLFAIYGTKSTAPPRGALPQERGTFRILALGASRN